MQVKWFKIGHKQSPHGQCLRGDRKVRGESIKRMQQDEVVSSSSFLRYYLLLSACLLPSLLFSSFLFFFFSSFLFFVSYISSRFSSLFSYLFFSLTCNLVAVEFSADPSNTLFALPLPWLLDEDLCCPLGSFWYWSKVWNWGSRFSFFEFEDTPVRRTKMTECKKMEENEWKLIPSNWNKIWW